MEKITLLQAKKLKKPPLKELNRYENLWFQSKGQSYLFKLPCKNKKFRYTLFNEVLISKICQELNISCQKATFGEYKIWNLKGTLIQSFLNTGQKEISIDLIQADFVETELNKILGTNYFEKYIYPVLKMYKYKRPKETTFAFIKSFDEKILQYPVNKIKFLQNLIENSSYKEQKIFNNEAILMAKKHSQTINDLDNIFNSNPTDCDIVKFAKIYAKKYNFQLEPNFQDKLVIYAIFDYLTLQTDRNTTNISFIQENNTLKLAPLFDNGLCLDFSFKYNRTEPYINHFGSNKILMTEFTQTKLNESDYIKSYLNKIQNFVSKNYDEFSKNFILQNQNCADYLFINSAISHTEIEKQEFLKSYLKTVQEVMEYRLNTLNNEETYGKNSQLSTLDKFLNYTYNQEMQK